MECRSDESERQKSTRTNNKSLRGVHSISQVKTSKCLCSAELAMTNALASTSLNAGVLIGLPEVGTISRFLGSMMPSFNLFFASLTSSLCLKQATRNCDLSATIQFLITAADGAGANAINTGALSASLSALAAATKQIEVCGSASRRQSKKTKNKKQNALSGSLIQLVGTIVLAAVQSVTIPIPLSVPPFTLQNRQNIVAALTKLGRDLMALGSGFAGDCCCQCISVNALRLVACVLNCVVTQTTGPMLPAAFVTVLDETFPVAASMLSGSIAALNTLADCLSCCGCARRRMSKTTCACRCLVAQATSDANVLFAALQAAGFGCSKC